MPTGNTRSGRRLFESDRRNVIDNIETPKSVNDDELVRQVQTAFDAWRAGAEIDSIRMLQLGLILGRVGRDNARLQRYFGIAWELAERGAQVR